MQSDPCCVPRRCRGCSKSLRSTLRSHAGSCGRSRGISPAWLEPAASGTRPWDKRVSVAEYFRTQTFWSEVLGAQLSVSLLGALAAAGWARTGEAGVYSDKVVLACPRCARELPGASLGDAITCWSVGSCSVLGPVTDSSKRRGLVLLYCWHLSSRYRILSRRHRCWAKLQRQACSTAADEGDAAEIKKRSL